MPSFQKDLIIVPPRSLSSRLWRDSFPMCYQLSLLRPLVLNLGTYQACVPLTDLSPLGCLLYGHSSSLRTPFIFSISYYVCFSDLRQHSLGSSITV